MTPSDDELDQEIRGHLALSEKEHRDRGEDPETARRAARKEFGNPMLTRDAMRSVWRPGIVDAVDALLRDIRFAWRALLRVKGLALTVVMTLALGIGANAAIFSVVRGVLLRPLVNRDEDRLVYIRQSAPGLGTDNLTFSMPEIEDFKARVTSITAFGDFSTINFTVLGLGEPREVRAGVVSGSYFDVMGLRPALGRLLHASDDGKDAQSVAVLTYRFWANALGSDPSVVGRQVQMGGGSTTVVGVLEPSVPYPAETELIANVVSSPHHLGATMVTDRRHRMTELFGRLAPGATVESARAEIASVHAAFMREHPEAYPPNGDVQVSTRLLREQITAPARPVLLVLLGAAALVFLIACSNVANLILARSVRREGELAVRAALGAGTGALRRTLLAESLLLCGAGAVLGVLLARPFVTVLAGYASRFTVRALDVRVDASLLWVGVALATVASVLLAWIPRLPSTSTPHGFGLGGGGVRITAATNRRLRGFAVAQIALSFVLLAGAGMLVAALVALQSARTGYDLRHVLAIDVPSPSSTQSQGTEFYLEAIRRISTLPGVERAASGSYVPWRDIDTYSLHFAFAVQGYAPANGEEQPVARLRAVSPGFFDTLGVPFVAGRDFTEQDRAGEEQVVLVSQSLAQRMFPDGDALGHKISWMEPLFGPPLYRRIVGVVADVDDEHVVPGQALVVYHSFLQFPAPGGRLFVRAAGDPYALVPSIAKAIHEVSADQPVERAATLEDVRTEILSPDRLNAFVVSGFAGVALLIAIVGVAGVLAFSVSARTREFGVRLAVGSTPGRLLARVLSEGTAIAVGGITVGAAGGYLLDVAAARYFTALPLPGPLPVAAAGAALVAAAVAASIVPAARASRVDVVQALRAE